MFRVSLAASAQGQFLIETALDAGAAADRRGARGSAVARAQNAVGGDGLAGPQRECLRHISRVDDVQRGEGGRLLRGDRRGRLRVVRARDGTTARLRGGTCVHAVIDAAQKAARIIPGVVAAGGCRTGSEEGSLIDKPG